jgi:hypothetical protein
MKRGGLSYRERRRMRERDIAERERKEKGEKILEF